MTKAKNIGRGGKRHGAGRPRKLRELPAGPVDPEAVLHEIAGDRLQPASARVAAAKALIAGERGESKAPGARATDAERALEIMNRGRPN